MRFPLVEDWSGGGPTGRDLVSQFLNHANTEVCNSFTSIDYILIEILFSRPINYLANIWIFIPWAYLLWMLMDYAIECDKIIDYHHMVLFLGFWGQVVGVFLWVKCSMVDFIEHLDGVGILSYLDSIFFYIAYLRLELISVVIFVFCGLPLAIEIFSS